MVLPFLGVEIAELDCRERIIACGTGDSEVLDGTGTGHAAGGGLEVVGDLGVVLLKALGPIDGGGLEELHVTRTADSEGEGDSFVGLDIGG